MCVWGGGRRKRRKGEWKRQGLRGGKVSCGLWDIQHTLTLSSMTSLSSAARRERVGKRVGERGVDRCET